ncbi:hypothetical protein Pla175_31150 [Pirellulimonas nuda]|uniref:Uncharacterized protein n=1 Tax=Pirellulimonas nuda TaxID=2528009 RepID=A0A518DE22_9BACT|nr:hypothetical protein Pla175_31150 [Pirellulimonas nuda]
MAGRWRLMWARPCVGNDTVHVAALQDHKGLPRKQSADVAVFALLIPEPPCFRLANSHLFWENTAVSDLSDGRPGGNRCAQTKGQAMTNWVRRVLSRRCPIEGSFVRARRAIRGPRAGSAAGDSERTRETRGLAGRGEGFVRFFTPRTADKRTILVGPVGPPRGPRPWLPAAALGRPLMGRGGDSLMSVCGPVGASAFLPSSSRSDAKHVGF